MVLHPQLFLVDGLTRGGPSPKAAFEMSDARIAKFLERTNGQC